MLEPGDHADTLCSCRNQVLMPEPGAYVAAGRPTSCLPSDQSMTGP